MRVIQPPFCISAEKPITLRRLAAQVAVIVFSIFTSHFSLAQDNTEAKLYQEYKAARSDSVRVVILGQLSSFYYGKKDQQKGDSIIEKQIMLAEATRNQNLILIALFGNAGYNSTNSSTRERSVKTINYINRALEYARTNGLTGYTALAYSNLANLYLADGKLDEAFKYANIGFTTALNTPNDSVKAICGLELGNIYVQKGEMLMGYKTYTNAYDIANQSEKHSLLSAVYHSISGLYKKLGSYELAKEYIFRSLEINTKNKDVDGQLEDYISLGKLYDYEIAKDYLLRAEHLADSVHNYAAKIQAQKILFSYKMVEEKPAVTFAYLDNHSGLKNLYENTGPHYLDWMIAEVYLYGNIPDSAILYFKKAEQAFDEGYDLTSKKNFLYEFADCYQKLNNIPRSIEYYTKAIDLCKTLSDLNGIKNFYNELKNLYYQQANYKLAFESGSQFEIYKDSVDQLSKEKDLALLEIDNENKKRQQDLELAQQRELRRHNLQYMGITVMVVSAFVLLIIIGMFKVSTFTIRTMGFISFIFLFEFVVMFLDRRIHDITHGEPWKIWFIKIAIISILYPLHHYTEQKLIHYLISRKLIHIRNRFSIRKFIGSFKKTPPAITAEGEEIILEKKREETVN